MLVELVNLSITYGDRIVIEDASGFLRAGEVTVLMGPSGSGKSSILGAIAGAITASRGHVVVPDGARIEWIVQTTPMLQRRRTLDNAALSAVVSGVHPDLARLRAMRSLRRVGVAHLARERTHRLSGGEKQRVAVARAMAVDASVVLADEPTASLDARARDTVCDALDAAAANGAVVVVATHDEAVAERAQRVLRIHEGQLAEHSL